MLVHTYTLGLHSYARLQWDSFLLLFCVLICRDGDFILILVTLLLLSVTL